MIDVFQFDEWVDDRHQWIEIDFIIAQGIFELLCQVIELCSEEKVVAIAIQWTVIVHFGYLVRFAYGLESYLQQPWTVAARSLMEVSGDFYSRSLAHQ